jgi:hypothetical protein
MGRAPEDRLLAAWALFGVLRAQAESSFRAASVIWNWPQWRHVTRTAEVLGEASSGAAKSGTVYASASPARVPLVQATRHLRTATHRPLISLTARKLEHLAYAKRFCCASFRGGTTACTPR